MDKNSKDRHKADTKQKQKSQKVDESKDNASDQNERLFSDLLRKLEQEKKDGG